MFSLEIRAPSMFAKSIFQHREINGEQKRKMLRLTHCTNVAKCRSNINKRPLWMTAH